MPEYPFNNNSSQAERRRVLEERRGLTYQGHAIACADDERGGRFALSGNATAVTGSTPASEYPRQPEHSPWHRDPMPAEPPLGYAIDEQEPTGERFEVERSKSADGKPTQMSDTTAGTNK